MSALEGLAPPRRRAQALRVAVELQDRAAADPIFRAALALAMVGQLHEKGQDKLAAEVKRALLAEPTPLRYTKEDHQ